MTSVRLLQSSLVLEGERAMNITPFTPDDWLLLLDLLKRVGLPRDGLEAHRECTLVIRDGPTIIGCAAIECYGGAGLLRSVAVDAAHRGRGVGEALVRAAIELAQRRGLHTLYLLTTSAADYFARFGFRAVSRDDVALAVRQSVEFNDVCPASAVVMQLDVQAGESLDDSSLLIIGNDQRPGA
jgi:amino-acid N-acetyltransferase